VNTDKPRVQGEGSNRTYAETIQLKDRFPQQSQIVAKMDPLNFGAAVPALKQYDR
tara:strand:+ start:135029 stop:135193 length:165 start_codon:yes stop_codon:yes gene_type:complete